MAFGLPDDSIERKSADIPDIRPSVPGGVADSALEPLPSPDPREASVPIQRSEVPEEYFQEDELLTARAAEIQNGSSFGNTMSASWKMYNSIGAYAEKQEGQDAYGFTDEEIDQEDDSFNIRNHPELKQGLPLYYRRDMSSAKNYKHALVMRYRMLSRVQDARLLQEAGLGYQLIGGLAAAGLDPLSWLGGGLVAVVGKGGTES